MAQITTTQINEILKTLPIGYYTGRQIKVELDTTSDTSFYSPVEDKIYFSANNILDLVTKAATKDMTQEQLEQDIRTILYHEVSHAILSPQIKHVTAAINIVEDERIESLMEDYFFGIDFRDYTRRLNEDGTSFEDDSIINKFFRCVRFKEGPSFFVETLNKILNKYHDLNKNSYKCEIRDYISAITIFYDEFKKYFSQNKPESQSQDSKDNQEGLPQSDSGNNGMSPESSDENQQNSAQNDPDQKAKEQLEKALHDCGMSDEDLSDENREIDEQEYSLASDAKQNGGSRSIPQQISEVLDKYQDDSLTKDLSRIFTSANKVRKMNSAAINSYSGILDPRSCSREDCRFFVQKNRNGSSRAYSKIHLNLFLDRSGSFSSNDDVANQILSSLIRIEKQFPDFDFTLITCGIGEDIANKKNLKHRSYDGTQISSKIFDTYKAVQKPSCINYNIVLYDGLAYDTYAKKGEDGWIGNFGAFNHDNVLIITDYENRSATDKYCKNARVKISWDYTADLKTNLIEMLEKLVH